MFRFKKLLAVAGLSVGMLFSLGSAARAEDWDHDGWRDRDRYEQRERYPEYWRDRDGRYFRRVWDPYRGWIVVRYYPAPQAWERHDNGRHLGWYKHEYRERHDRDDDD